MAEGTADARTEEEYIDADITGAGGKMSDSKKSTRNDVVGNESMLYGKCRW
jgi:hypothetical protein